MLIATPLHNLLGAVTQQMICTRPEALKTLCLVDKLERVYNLCNQKDYIVDA